MSLAEPDTARPLRSGALRLATPRDAEDLWMFLRGLGEGFDNGVPADATLDELVALTASRDKALAVVAREHGKIVATMGLTINKHWYSSDVLLSGAWHYVLPTHRRSPYAKNMLRMAKDYANATRLPLVMTVEAAAEPKRRLYARELSPYGGLFIVPPQEVPQPLPVRPATAADWPVVELVARWLGGNNAAIEVDYAQGLGTLRKAVEGTDFAAGTVGICTLPNGAFGAIALRVERDPSGADKLVEVFVAVPPMEGSGAVSAHLLDYAKWLGWVMKLPLHIGVASVHRPETKVRLYKRRFGEPVRLFFHYRGGVQ